MAKDNNLRDFLTDIANAIRSKKNISNLINPQDFSTEITTIEAGGIPIVENDLTFYDYDGSIVYAYSREEVEGMTKLPVGPYHEHEGLLFDGWSSTLEEVKSCIANYGKWGVGAFYITDDNSLRLYITLERESQLNVTLKTTSRWTSKGKIHWGDGQETEIETGSGTFTHEYTSFGDYVISIKLSKADGFSLGTNALGQTGANAASYILRKVEMSPWIYGNSVNPFNKCKRLETITFANAAYPTESNHGDFVECLSLKHICFPLDYGTLTVTSCVNLKTAIVKVTGTTGNDKRINFSKCTSLESVYTTGLSSLGDRAFAECIALKTYVSAEKICYATPRSFLNCQSLKDIKNDIVLSYYLAGNDYESYFSGCVNLEGINLTSGKILYKAAFFNCIYLKKLTVPSSIMEIRENALYGCSSLEYVDFSKHTSIPTLINSNAFYGIPTNCKIIVPYYLYNEWKEASVWSEKADYIESDLIPEECLSLEIEADDIIGNMTSTKVRCVAVVNGITFNGERVEGVTIEFTVTSDEFEMNESETESVIREITYTYLGVTASTTITQGPFKDICYSVDLNEQWRESTTVANPDRVRYDGVYESFSNYNVASGYATMYVDIEGYTDFTLYIRSYAESTYDYVMVSQPDQEITGSTSYSNSSLVKAHTYGTQNSGTTIGSYKEVSYTGLDGGPHRITIVYRKDGSGNSGTDRGYVLIPKQYKQ